MEYWQKVQRIDPKNLVFIDEMGVLLGLTRTHARSPHGSRVYDSKPFYRGSKVTVIGAISARISFSCYDFKWFNGWKCI